MPRTTTSFITIISTRRPFSLLCKPTVQADCRGRVLTCTLHCGPQKRRRRVAGAARGGGASRDKDPAKFQLDLCVHVGCSFLLTSLPLSFSSLSPSLSSLSLPLVSLAVFKMPSQNKGDAPKQHCRYYKQRFPEVDDVVMVNVRSIAGLSRCPPFSFFLEQPAVRVCVCVCVCVVYTLGCVCCVCCVGCVCYVCVFEMIEAMHQEC